MGIRDSFRRSFNEGFNQGYQPKVAGGEGSLQQIPPKMVGRIGEQLLAMCGSCKNGRGLGEGALKEGGTIAVFSCVKQRPGGCRIIDGAAASANTNTGVSITPVDIEDVSGVYGTKVSVSHRK